MLAQKQVNVAKSSFNGVPAQECVVGEQTYSLKAIRNSHNSRSMNETYSVIGLGRIALVARS
jgi:hypothetical protein